MINVNVTGLSTIEVKLKGLTEALDVNEVLDEAEALLLNRIRARFLEERGPQRKWKRSKAAIKEGRKTLFKTGTLFHSIQAFKRGPNERAIGTDVKYAKYHQYGVGDMFRPFLGFNKKDLELIERAVISRVEELLK